MQRSEEHRGTRQVALGLGDGRLQRKGKYVVRCDIENLIKLAQCVGEPPKCDVGKAALREKANIARVEPLGFVKVGLAPIPLASPPRYIGQRFRNPAAVGQE